jgi:hypothetical protein
MDSNEDYAGAIAMEGTKTYAALAWFPLPVFDRQGIMFHPANGQANRSLVYKHLGVFLEGRILGMRQSRPPKNTFT